MKIQIKQRFTELVLYECETPEGIKSGSALRHALEKAAQGDADLSDAYLSGAK